MLFNSEAYLFFLPVVVALNWALPARWRPVFLVAASYFFYASWYPPFLLLIFGLTLVNYFIGARQGRLAPRRRGLLVLSLVVNLVALGVFKYLGFLDESVDRLAAVIGLPAVLPAVRILLPLGLSFFTFEFIHYQVDVFRGGDPIVNPIEFALFPAFFPTQISGPIKRYQDFEAQVVARPRFDAALFMQGVELVAWGLFKKVAIADTLLPAVAVVYGRAGEATLVDAWIGLVGFYVQLYFDFSGYTDIGRGSSQLLGYRVPVNFDMPYLATTFQDFWRRWHMSLSFWLRDYLYFALGGSRRGTVRARVNLLLTMILAGLWHGAGWTYALMGTGFGLGLILDRAIRPWWARLPGPLRVAGGWALTQLIFMLSIHFFRSPNVATALRLWRVMLTGGLHRHLLSNLQIVEVVTALVLLLAGQLLVRRFRPREWLERSAAQVVLRPAYALSLLAGFGYFLAVARETHAFYYFQF